VLFFLFLFMLRSRAEEYTSSCVGQGESGGNSVNIVLENEADVAQLPLQWGCTKWTFGLESFCSMWDWHVCPVPRYSQPVTVKNGILISVPRGIPMNMGFWNRKIWMWDKGIFHTWLFSRRPYAEKKYKGPIRISNMLYSYAILLTPHGKKACVSWPQSV